eukprot:jgi/Orpsp1_1/1178421/evm.model.c7180000065216.1
MQSKLIYICIIVTICIIKTSFTQRGYYNEPTIKFINADSQSIEKAINEVIGTIADSLLGETKNTQTISNDKTKTNANTITDSKSLVDEGESVNGLIEAAEETIKTTKAPIPNPVTSAYTTTVQKSSTTTTMKTTSTQSSKPTTTVQTQNASQPKPTQNSVPQNQSSTKSSSQTTNTNISSNKNSSVSNNVASNSSTNNGNPNINNVNVSSNNINNSNTNNSNNVEDTPVSNAVAPAEAPAPVDNSSDSTPNVIPDIVSNTLNKDDNKDKSLPQDSNSTTKNENNKSKLASIAIKVGAGLAIGGICVAGLIVGKNKLGKKDDDDIYKNVFNAESLPASISANDSLGRKLEGVDNTPNYDYQPINNYSQKIQTNNYLNPNIPSPNSPVNNDFIDTNSIEPLPNLVNKVDVELPVYNIHEENYNTVGRPMDEIAAAATWNEDEEASDKTNLLNNNNNINTEGYNNIVPEMGQMVIEHTNCPSFTSSMFEAMDELQEENKNEDNNDNMKQIIPDIQYATVEVNNEFDSIVIDDEPTQDNMKQIIPDIQYATVEVNNEFDSIDIDDDFRSTRTNPRIVVDIDAQRSSMMSSTDSDVQELRASQDFLSMPESLANFKQISETYHNALRDTFDGGNRDSLSSTDSILHKLR